MYAYRVETAVPQNGHHLHPQVHFNAAQVRRREALNAIQRGKYAAVAPLPGASWPFEAFAASKTEEKLTEERCIPESTG